MSLRSGWEKSGAAMRRFDIRDGSLRMRFFASLCGCGCRAASLDLNRKAEVWPESSMEVGTKMADKVKKIRAPKEAKTTEKPKAEGKAKAPAKPRKTAAAKE